MERRQGKIAKIRRLIDRLTLSVVLILMLAVAAVLTVALAALLLMPLRLSATLQTAPQLTYKVDLRLLGHGVPHLPLLDSTRPRKDEGKAQKKWASQGTWQPAIAENSAGKKSRLGRTSVSRMVRALPELLNGVVHAIRWESFHLDAEFGLDDPADTGQVYGCLTPLQYGAPWPPGVSIVLRPNFERTCLNGELQTTLCLRLAALLAPATRFAWRVFGPRQ